jgi:hypothetical protein
MMAAPLRKRTRRLTVHAFAPRRSLASETAAPCPGAAPAPRRASELAMRYVRADGKIGWKPTQWMLDRLADAERDAIDDLARFWPAHSGHDSANARLWTLVTLVRFAKSQIIGL